MRICPNKKYHWLHHSQFFLTYISNQLPLCKTVKNIANKKAASKNTSRQRLSTSKEQSPQGNHSSSISTNRASIVISR